MHFDETVHLAAVGGGFLRTPFLTATQEAPTDPRPGQMPVLSPQIIHIPSAGRKSGLNLHDPAFRRAVFSSTLCKTLTRDAAAQANQEGAGITFGFSDSPNRNMAKARLNPGLSMMGDPILLLDDSGNNLGRPIDVNLVQPNNMTTGFLVFVSRYWQDLRNVDADLLLRHHIPLQFDCDFDVVPMSSSPFRVYLPILGNQGLPIVYDAAFGPSSYNPAGTTPITDGGTVEILPDGQGGYLIDLNVIPSNEGIIALTLADPSGQVFSRNIIIQDGWPAGAVVKFPHGMAGIPYYCSLPCNDVLCRIFGNDCASGNLDSDIQSMTLPAGLNFNADYSAIEGIPTEYGTNFGIVPTSIVHDGLQSLGVSLTINRPPRNLLTIAEALGNDRATGEYYSAQFMPFGSVLAYGGHAYEFRRWLSNDEAWPGIRQTPYLYGAASRQSSVAQEGFWREVP
jgi:hypothetical protein